MKRYTLPKGFLAGAVHCGIKRKRKDLSLFYSEVPCKIAAIFTKNVVKAAPVILAIKQLKKTDSIRAVVVNSGNANCMTGKRGLNDAKKMARHMAKLLKVSENEVLVSSTGVIGRFMPMKSVIKGLATLSKEFSADGLLDAANGIITTDRFCKISARSFEIGRKMVTITGVAKGAGMIQPDMATMLCYILTDADVEKKSLKKALVSSSEDSFNAITVDGDMSTNDTVMLLANGEAGNNPIKEGTEAFKVFQKNLDEVSRDLAKMIVEDGEGAVKFMEVYVNGAKTKNDASKAALATANSLLVKCAVLGGDPNWGRIGSSIGSSGIDFDPDKMEIKLDGVVFFKKGGAVPFPKQKALSVFKGKKVKIEVDLHSGKNSAIVYSCDISGKYIKLNSDYTS
ncbi:MAG: bifunctional glutamate N-acetyltransferase/amino-acid acetyltransferase ArgJ [Candidatus Omnitrophota bacterium]